MKRFYFELYTFEYTLALIPSLSIHYFNGSSGTGRREVTASLEFLKWDVSATIIIDKGCIYD
jgi:hypothetical protein